MSRLGHQEMTNSSCVSHDILHQHCLIFNGHPQALRQGIPSSPPVRSAHITHVKTPSLPPPQVFLTFSPFSLSICSRWSFYVVALQPAQLSRSPFSPARPTKRRVSHPTSPPHATLFFSLVCREPGLAGGGTHFSNVLGYSPWPARGWPEPGPPGPTPPDPSRCPRRIGTVGQTQDQSCWV